MPLPERFRVESPKWLWNLRWLLIAGLSLFAVGEQVLGTNFLSSQIFLVLGLFALWNFSLHWIEPVLGFEAATLIFWEIFVDLLFITIVLWFSGGLQNPFVGFYILTVLVGGLLLHSRLIMAVGFVASCCVLSLLWAPTIEAGPYQDPFFRFASPLALVILIFLTTTFILVYLRRLGAAQEQYRQQVKMDAMGRLVAGLGHEIGTPLNSILVLARDLDSSVPEEFRKSTGTIISQTRRCGDIVSLLMGYSNSLLRTKEAVGYAKVELVPWLRDIYAGVVESESRKLRDQAPLQESFLIEAPGLPNHVDLPVIILGQVLENLLKNARDAVRGVESPQIALRVFLRKSLYGGLDWVFSVEDNGAGFSEEEKGRAFEAFYTTKKPGKGIGLGLYISYYLLAQVDGRIVIEKNSVAGASIQVSLPKLES